MALPSLLGHEEAQDLVRNFRGHALLLTGPEGVGRRALAHWYNAYLNCEKPKDSDPCGTCKSCATPPDKHPDYRELFPQTSTTSGKRSRNPEIRIGELVVRQGNADQPLVAWLEQRPIYKRRVGVVDGAQHLTRSAANSFLKTLEAPPNYATIILIAPSKSAVLPTVTSRCTQIRLGPVDTSDFSDLDFLPAYRLGQIGPLLRARSNLQSAKELAETVSALVASLERDLSNSFEIAERLENHWLVSNIDIFTTLREHFRLLPPTLYYKASNAIDRCETRLKHYGSASLAFVELILNLRKITR